MPRKVNLDDDRPLPEWLDKIAAIKRAKGSKLATATDPKNVSQKMAVDHRNVRISWKTSAQLKEEEFSTTRKHENTLEPPPVPFPWAIRPTKAFEDSAVAEFARSRGTRRKFLTSPAWEATGQLTGVEPPSGDSPMGRTEATEFSLPEPPDEDTYAAAAAAVVEEEETNPTLSTKNFLRLDESKIPIEIFDSSEFEEKDLTPEEWIEDAGKDDKGEVHGFAAFYVATGESRGWRWRKCRVKGYDAGARQFFIELGLKSKSVSRLNLRFALEDEALWHRRRAVAFEGKEDVKRQLRLDYFIAEQPTTMRAIQQRALRGIHAKVHDGLPAAIIGAAAADDDNNGIFAKGGPSSKADPKQQQQQQPPQQRQQQQQQQLTATGGQPAPRLTQLLTALTTDVIHAYARAMKRAIVRQRYASEPAFAAEYDRLKLPARAVAPPAAAPALAKVPVPEHPYVNRRLAVAQQHFSSSRQVLETFMWLRTTWEDQFARERFVVVDRDPAAACSSFGGGAINARPGTAPPTRDHIPFASRGVPPRVGGRFGFVGDDGGDYYQHNGGGSSLLPFALPCDMDDFVEAQQRKCDDFAAILRSDWRTAFAEQIVDNIQDVFDFFQSNSAAFEAGPLRRLLTHFDLRMTSQLRDALCDSLDDWVAFIRRYTTVPGDDEEEDTTVVVVRATKMVSEPTGALSSSAAATKARTVGMRAPPLFAVKLTVATGPLNARLSTASEHSASHGSLHAPSVRIEPSHEDLEAALVARIDEPVERIREFKTVDKDLMSLLHLPERLLLDVGGSSSRSLGGSRNPLVADVDAKLDWARAEVKRLLAGAMSWPQALADRYSQFAWIAAVEPVSHVRAFVRSEPSLDDYVAEVARFHVASNAVERLSENVERYPFCAVDTTGAKKALTSKAREVELALLTHIVHEARTENEATISRYEQILARLAEQPTNEAELAALKDFIADSRVEVLKMVEAVEAMHAKLARFDEFCVLPLSRDDTFLAWSTMEFPKRVHDASSECEMRIEMDKVRMMDRLAMEKNDFDELLQQFDIDVRRAREYADYAMEHKYVEEINGLQDAITEAKLKAKDFNAREAVFGFPPTEYAELHTVEVELNPYWDLWNMISDFHSNQHEWLHGAFLDLDGSKIQKEVEVWWKQSYKLKQTLEDKTPGAAECAAALREETSKFREHLPMIQALASPALKERHWQHLSDKIGSKMTPYDEHGVELTLQGLLDMKTYEYIDAIQEVCVAAEKEYGLERQLQSMKDDWALVAFEVKAYKTTGTSIVGGIDEIVTLLDDHIVKTQTMCGSMFIKAIEEDAKAWEAQLKYAQALVDEWVACQRVWMYLEPIFGSEDIMRQLPTEARRFNDVDKLWRATMKATEEDPIFIAQAEPSKKLKRKFIEANEKLDKIQKGLSDYLEMKRLFFPRFFFLADEQMLEILSQSKEPRAVQPHLGKAFEGLNQVHFEKDLKISEMISAEGERVALTAKVDPESAANKGNVERWLLELESLQWASVRKQVELAIADYPTKTRTQWTLGWCAQAILAAAAAFWTADVEKTMKAGGSKLLGGAYVEELNRGLTDIVMLVRGQLSKLQRQTLGALVVMDVHARDTVLTMVTELVDKVTDFGWVSQLRYYWAPSWKDGQAVKKGDSTVVARIVNARCLYGYEYLGNSMRLVITPLTDRCYRTMISAIDLLYGGAPEGPAGTGKTETVKDLSKAMAIQCVVFNCSDGLDYRAMGKFFKGLAGCGSWACFDAEDHELLTNKGFLSLDEVLACKDPNLQFASYDAKEKLLLYEHCRAIVVNDEEEQEMVEFTHEHDAFRWADDADVYGRSAADINRMDFELQLAKDLRTRKSEDPDFDECSFAAEKWAARDIGGSRADRSNRVSVVATANHNMFVKLGNLNAHKTHGYQTYFPALDDFETVKAGELADRGDVSCLKMMGSAEAGVHVPADSQTAAGIGDLFDVMGLDTLEKREAFCEFYGFWLGDGTLMFLDGRPYAIAFNQYKDADITYLQEKFEKCGIEECYVKISSEVYVAGRARTRKNVLVMDPTWLRFFFYEYAHHYRACDLVKTAVWLFGEKNTDQIDPWIRSRRRAVADSTKKLFDDDDEGADSTAEFSETDKKQDLANLVQSMGSNVHKMTAEDEAKDEDLSSIDSYERGCFMASKLDRDHLAQSLQLRRHFAEDPDNLVASQQPRQLFEKGFSEEQIETTKFTAESTVVTPARRVPPENVMAFPKFDKSAAAARIMLPSVVRNSQMRLEPTAPRPGWMAHLPFCRPDAAVVDDEKVERATKRCRSEKREERDDAQAFLVDLVGEESFRRLRRLMSNQTVPHIDWNACRRIVAEQLKHNGVQQPYPSQACYAVATIYCQIRIARQKPAQYSLMKKAFTAGGLFLWETKNSFEFNRCAPETKVMLPPPEPKPEPEPSVSEFTLFKEVGIDEGTKSAKLVWWAFRLSRSLARAILLGVRMADGLAEGSFNIIFTASARFRDHLVRLALHGGYSARYQIINRKGAAMRPVQDHVPVATVDKWAVTYAAHGAGNSSCHNVAAEPVLMTKTDVLRRGMVQCRTWCASMPSGFVVVRRVRRDPQGAVVYASRPTIQNNCFDEFNRINVEVLSVIAQQILTINKGKAAGVDKFHFEGTFMKLNPNANPFITMNPGYAGRAELPDNLKALFRPCAMMVPDYALIGEIRLYSFGFEDARKNAQKLVRTLQLCSEQLSSQKHYDYGMRAVNSILVAAGNLRLKVGDDPMWDESKIVLRSVMDVNLPKFTAEDLPLFRGITSDLFPGVMLPEAEHGALIPTIDEVCMTGVSVAPGRTFKLDPTPEFTLKIVQLYEMVLVRHGVMVVGETCSGKTCGIHALASAMTRCHERGELLERVRVNTVNPKSILSGQLYGNFDENTHEWSDGILAVIFRDAAMDTGKDRIWIMFDGPVDAVWIENMNTVLDDNKKLCLMSGEIIKMTPRMTMMFEAEDLEQASPATVSRVGMIFTETRNLGWRPFLKVWLEALEAPFAEHAGALDKLYAWVFPPAVYFVAKFCAVPTPVTQIELMRASLRLMDCFMSAGECGTDVERSLEGMFVKAMIWSVGACVDFNGRLKFDAFLRLVLAGDPRALNASPEYRDFKSKTPAYNDSKERSSALAPPDEKDNASSVYDFRFSNKSCTWSSWVDPAQRFVIPKDAEFNSIVVPTVDTVRHEWLVQAILLEGYHVLCTGETGTGKSVTVKNHRLVAGTDEAYGTVVLNFSAQTGANQTQDIIDSKLEKRRKGVIGAPLGKKVFIFVDDLNMPAKEEYGAQPAVEILRQWMDHAGWYDRSTNEYRQLVDIQFVAAMGPPGGGRTQITQRYVRHFNVLNFVPFNAESLTRVFTTILDWSLSRGFNTNVKGFSGLVVASTIDMYDRIARGLLPTPTKSHYTFNLRDLSKVFQGLAQGDASLVTEKEALVKLWCHESLRVFHDRLINDSDRAWFVDALATSVKANFNVDYAMRIAPLDGLPLMFGDYVDTASAKRLYREVPDEATLHASMSHFLAEFNMQSSNPMSLVLFLNAMEHISRIARVLKQPYGNALLMGVGGSGRKSLTTLAVFICDYELVQIEISKSYGKADWAEDLKRIFRMAGAQNGTGTPTVFLFDDTQIVYESFLEDVNLVLNTGEVPNLFATEDLVAINDDIAKSANQAGVNTAVMGDMYKYFISRCRANLHVVLCLSPIGDAFRRRLRMFPALVNCTTLDWFSAWPEEALRSVAKFFLAGLDDLAESMKEGVVNVCVNMQERVSAMSERYVSEMGRHYYVTPTSYLQLIGTFKKLLAVQSGNVAESKLRYDNGLEKIESTNNQVDGMQRDLEALQPKLKQATVDTDALIEKIAVDTTEANKVEEVVNKERAACEKQAREASDIATSCQADLDKAMPALEGAINALKSLSKSDIVEIKAMKKPPDAVKLVMEAVCIMCAVKPDKVKDPGGGTKKVDDYWGPAQKHLLSDSRFLQNLMDYDKDHMEEPMVAKVRTYTAQENFSVDVVKKASVAAAGLCKWVNAMMIYDKVAKDVGPKRKALKEAEQSLQEASEALAAKEAALKEVQDKLAALNDQLAGETKKKADLEKMVLDCATKLDRAEQLIKGLGGERSRWTELSKQLEAEFENVTGDVLLASGVVAYLGAFVVSYRNEAIEEWKARLKAAGIPRADTFTLRATLGDEVTIRSWVINKLPNDAFSVENAIMLERSSRWPLMIDPQGQANRWVKKTYAAAEGDLKVVKLNQATFARTIENAIPFGLPVLIENVGEVLDPVLEPILLKQVSTLGGVKTLRFGDASLEYDDRFLLFITTKLRNPHYPPELCVKVNLLNFMATAEGLEDQMLGLAVACEESALEAQREQLVMEDAENKRQLKEIEDKILYLLRVAEGNILDDENLIDTLKESKLKSKKIEEKVRDAARTSDIIAKTRKGYKPVAFHASQLFFCIADLSLIDPMYQYSMEWYQALFREAIGRAAPAPDLEERLQNLIDTFTAVLYVNVCRSLFEKDKLLFSFLLCIKIMAGKGKLDPAHLRFFLAGNTSMERDRDPPAAGQDWINDKLWGDVLALSKLPGVFSQGPGNITTTTTTTTDNANQKPQPFVEDFCRDLKAWHKIFESKAPMADLEAHLRLSAAAASTSTNSRLYGGGGGGADDASSSHPGGDFVGANEAAYTPFELMCVLRAIRPDAVVPQVQSFVAEEMGKRFIEVPSFDLVACYEDSRCNTPLLFVLTPGADPMSALYKLATDRGFMGNRLHAISLGQGQGDIAYAAISEAQDKGTWVCLQNAHLSISWMPTLERLCEELSPDRIHGDFRLWLTSEPSPYFPASILQNGIKMTMEPPKGMRANLMGSFTTQISEAFYDGSQRSREFKKLLYGLCFFHACVRERIKYGPLGWNIKYVFSGPDLQISMDQLRIFCDNTALEDELPYAALRYLTGECNYGGRVTDDKDRRCLANILTDFYTVAIQEDDGYKFSPSGTYFAPNVDVGASLDSVRDFIREKLPFTEGPELFGLHDNANISCALGETNLLLSTVLSMQPRSAGGAGKSWDETLAEVSADIEARLPPQYDIERALIDFPVKYDESMNTVLTQELLRFNKLTGLIKAKLVEVQRAIKGLVVMSGELEDMGNAMVNGKVPKVWASAAYPSRKPLASWVADLLDRLSHLQSWVDANVAPNVFWISGFFFTQAFITGTLQNYARKYELPIDTVAFDQEILTPQQEKDAPGNKPVDGSVCRGLFLEGARFDPTAHEIVESRPRELFTPVPMFLLLPKLKNDIEAVRGAPELYTGSLAGTAHVYMCPVYKESSRQGTLSTTGHSTNFVMFVRVPMKRQHDQKHWIKRGAAMLTQLDD